jgi:UDP-N-acetylmuramoylalanine-D-glutamate ligase
MIFVPDSGQLAQVMSQATAPAFVLGAVAAFIAVLLSRMTVVLDRIRSLKKALANPTTRSNDVQIPLLSAKYTALFKSFARWRNRGISDLR